MMEVRFFLRQSGSFPEIGRAMATSIPRIGERVLLNPKGEEAREVHDVSYVLEDGVLRAEVLLKE
ncbi:MAG: hypothetical protein J0H34_18355 [Rhizobiales bacterium]|nr:hypothetical protein [Hyphomicrobiales bacterium]